MSTNNDTDLFLVDRGGDLFNVPFSDMSNIQDTDLLLVSRDGVNYKMEAGDLNLVPPEAPIAEGNIVYDDVTANRFTEEEFTITAGAQAAAKTVSTSIKPYVVGLLGAAEDYTHGLRFDSTRSTKLSRSGSGTGTISYWKKDASTGWTWAHQHQTGAACPTEIGTSYDGYISEYYFVEDLDLPASAFAETIDGKLTPLESSVVKENIKGGVETPYDTRPNYEQDWSSSVSNVYTGNNSELNNGYQSVFDGDTTTSGGYATSNTGTQNQWSFTFDDPINVSSSVVLITNSSENHKFWGVNNLPEVSCVASPNEIAFNFTGTLDSISGRTTWDGNNGLALFGIIVDGRLLIDGPADNSQVWSGIATGTNDQFPDALQRLFDGVVSPNVSFSNSYSAAGNTFSVVTFSPPIDAAVFGEAFTSVDFLVGGAQTGSDLFYVNGVEITSGWNDSTWATINIATTQLSSFAVRHISGVTSIQIGGIKINGKLLVDAPTKWNTSEVWSSGVSINGSFQQGGPKNMFDGDLSTSLMGGASNPPYVITCVLPTEIPITNGLRFYGTIESGVPADSLLTVTYGDDVTETVSNTPGTDWYTFSNGTGKTLKSFAFKGPIAGSSNTNNYWQAVEVNGKILVDAGTFGDNGFYLPFDPEAAGYVYSSNVEPAAGFQAPAANAFDGSTSTAATFGVNGTFTFNFPDIPDVTKIELYTQGSGNLTTIDCNDGAVPVGNIKSNELLGYTEIYNSTPFTLSKLAFNVAGNSQSIMAFRVNGKILVDYNSIGVDDSGNGNHFQDENFAAGNTSQIWRSVNSTNGEGGTGSHISKNLFDGNPATTSGGKPFKLNPTTSIPVTTKVEIYGGETGMDQARVTIDGVDQSLVTLQGANWVTLFEGSGNITNLQIGDGRSFNGGQYAGSASLLKVDGKLLIDADVQDTVTDTPVRNYAVYETGRNGNLDLFNVAAGSIGPATTVLLSPTDQIYFEATYAASGTSDNTHLGVGNSSDSYYLRSDGQPENLTFVRGTQFTWQVGDTIGVLVDVPNNELTYFNGTDSMTWSPTSSMTAGGFFPKHASGSNNLCISNFGQQPFTASNVTYDQDAGTVEIDGVTYNTLFEGTAVASTERLYCVLDADLNITDLQETDPGFRLVDSPATVTFPATLATGNTPDVELPEGTSFGSEILVSNNEGSDTTTLAQVTPT